jgi:hypothetical protein
MVCFLLFLFNKKNEMKATQKIIAGIGLVTVVGLIVYLVRRQKTKRINKQTAELMKEQVAEQGYETAHDILFPKKNKRERKVKYGPEFPS